MTSPSTSAANTTGKAAQDDEVAPARDRREPAPSFDEMLDGCILRLIHKLPPTGLAPRRGQG